MVFDPPIEEPARSRLSREAAGRDGPIRVAPGGAYYHRRFHVPNCTWWPDPRRKPDSLGFPDKESAIAAGHRPCDLCKRDPPWPTSGREP